MRIVYTGEALPVVASGTRSLFLAGPTPRGGSSPSWRAEALELLATLGFDGVVFVPEFRDGIHREDAADSLSWDRRALSAADRVVFWVPRRLPERPGLTTNLELGYELAARPARVYLGRPEHADGRMAMDLLYEECTSRRPYASLRATIEGALERRSPTTIRTIRGYKGGALDFERLAAIPRMSDIEVASVSLDTALTRSLRGAFPLIPSPMDTVIGPALIECVLGAGGLVIDLLAGRSPQQYADQICARFPAASARRRIFVLVDPARALAGLTALAQAGLGGVALDTLHFEPHLHLRAVETLAGGPLQVISGNVVHGEDARRLIEAGADAIRVGMSAASINRGRELTGCGRSQGAAILRCAQAASGHAVPIIADGGVRSIGDAFLALALGASSVMMGRIFAALPESAAPLVDAPSGQANKRYRGMSRAGAISDELIAEGSEVLLPLDEPFAIKRAQWLHALRLGISRSGFRTLDELRRGAELEFDAG